MRACLGKRTQRQSRSVIGGVATGGKRKTGNPAEEPIKGIVLKHEGFGYELWCGFWGGLTDASYVGCGYDLIVSGRTALVALLTSCRLFFTALPFAWRE